MRADTGGHEGPRRRHLFSDRRDAMQERTTPAAPAVETAKPSAPEAVRRAIAALGYRAEVLEILDYVREHFGIGGPDTSEEVVAPAAEAPAPGDAGRKPATRRGKGKD